jgi:hypothetical protein
LLVTASGVASPILAVVDDDWQFDTVQPGFPVSHALVFSDEIAHMREDLVTDAVTFLESVPGVTGVEHEEREVIVLFAPGLTVAALTATFAAWWSAAIRERRPWQHAMDRAASRALRVLGPDQWRRDEWRLTRDVDSELSHVVDMEYYDDTVHLTATLRFTRVPGELDGIVHLTFKPGDEAALIAALTDQVLPALPPGVDPLLALWQGGRTAYRDGRRTYGGLEARMHARVLASRGRLGEARELFQVEFDRLQPTQRPYLLRLVEEHRAGPLRTGTDPRLSIADEQALVAWETAVPAFSDRLRGLVGKRLNESVRSVDKVSRWLQQSQGYARHALDGATPLLPPQFLGRQVHEPGEPWFLVLVELVAAYVGTVVIRQAPGTAWGVAHDGELALVRAGGANLLSQIHRAVSGGQPTLRGCTADLVRRVNDANSGPPHVVTPLQRSFPEPAGR